MQLSSSSSLSCIDEDFRSGDLSLSGTCRAIWHSADGDGRGDRGGESECGGSPTARDQSQESGLLIYENFLPGKWTARGICGICLSGQPVQGGESADACESKTGLIHFPEGHLPSSPSQTIDSAFWHSTDYC